MMLRLHCTLRCLSVLLLLVFQIAAQSIAGLLGHYRMAHKGIVASVADSSFSGVALDPTTGTLLVADDDSRSMYELTTSGDLVGSFDLYGFDDIEGIAFQAGRYILVVEERRGNVLRIQLPQERTGLIEKANCDVLFIEENIANSGLEDVTWQPSRHTGYAVKEKDPTKLFHLTFDGDGKPVGFEEMASFAWNISQGDAAGIFALADGNLLVLSEIRKTIFGVDTNGTVLSELIIDMLQPEGVTLDYRDSTIYVVGEPREMAAFKLNQVPVTNPDSRTSSGGGTPRNVESRHFITVASSIRQSARSSGGVDMQGRIVGAGSGKRPGALRVGRSGSQRDK